MPVRVFAAFLAAAALASAAAAARPAPLLVSEPWAVARQVIDQPVEHQSEGGMFCDPGFQACVYNPTKCSWDGDDFLWKYYGARLAAGETTVGTVCQVADWDEETTTLTVRSRSPRLDVTLSFDPQGRRFTAAPIEDGHDFVYRICVVGPDYDAGAPLPQVPASTGVGVETTVTATVRNDGPPREVRADLKAGWQGNAPCGATVTEGLNPRWSWSTS